MYRRRPVGFELHAPKPGTGRPTGRQTCRVSCAWRKPTSAYLYLCPGIGRHCNPCCMTHQHCNNIPSCPRRTYCVGYHTVSQGLGIWTWRWHADWAAAAKKKKANACMYACQSCMHVCQREGRKEFSWALSSASHRILMAGISCVRACVRACVRDVLSERYSTVPSERGEARRGDRHVMLLSYCTVLYCTLTLSLCLSLSTNTRRPDRRYVTVPYRTVPYSTVLNCPVQFISTQ